MDSNAIERYLTKLQHDYIDTLSLGCLPANGITAKNMKLHQLSKTKCKALFGVFNTDSASKPGTHWVALVISFPTKMILYYDPVGLPPMKSNRFLLQQIVQVLPDYQVKINQFQQQGLFAKNTTNNTIEINRLCGEYSLLFIKQILSGKTFKSATNYYPTHKQLYQFGKGIPSGNLDPIPP